MLKAVQDGGGVIGPLVFARRMEHIGSPRQLVRSENQPEDHRASFKRHRKGSLCPLCVCVFLFFLFFDGRDTSSICESDYLVV